MYWRIKNVCVCVRVLYKCNAARWLARGLSASQVLIDFRRGVGRRERGMESEGCIRQRIFRGNEERTLRECLLKLRSRPSPSIGWPCLVLPFRNLALPCLALPCPHPSPPSTSHLPILSSALGALPSSLSPFPSCPPLPCLALPCSALPCLALLSCLALPLPPSLPAFSVPPSYPSVAAMHVLVAGRCY